MWRPRFGIRRWWLWLAGCTLGLVAAAYAAAFLIDEPLRRSIERQMNASLNGYTVRLGAADFHPHGFSLDLKELIVTQDANPDPPVMHIPRLSGSVQWRALLHARLVGDILIERPSVYVNLKHLTKEIAEDTPIKERGWQDALQAAYPLTINQLEIKDGDVTYTDQGPFKPLRIRKLNIDIDNIRNIKSKDRVYPSELQLEGVIFEKGRLRVDGHADFLAEPFPGVRGRFTLEDMEVDYFHPVTRRYNVAVERGVLSSAGEFEYAPSFAAAALDHVTLKNAHVTYTHSPKTAAVESQVAAKTAQVARQVTDRPDVDIKVERVDVVNSTVGVVNQAATPSYRVFLTNADLHLRGLTNRSTQPAQVTLRGKFMGSGNTEAKAAFRPDQKGGNLDLKVAIEDTDMATMTDLLRSWVKFDVTGGRFSFYSEISVKNGALSGYVKPLFKDIVTSDPQKERSFGQKVYHKLVQGTAKLLKNRPRGEVATKADISGSLDNPQTSVWQIVGRLIKNAFFKAIGHGFEGESKRSYEPQRS